MRQSCRPNMQNGAERVMVSDRPSQQEDNSSSKKQQATAGQRYWRRHSAGCGRWRFAIKDQRPVPRCLDEQVV